MKLGGQKRFPRDWADCAALFSCWYFGRTFRILFILGNCRLTLSEAFTQCCATTSLQSIIIINLNPTQIISQYTIRFQTILKLWYQTYFLGEHIGNINTPKTIHFELSTWAAMKLYLYGWVRRPESNHIKFLTSFRFPPSSHLPCVSHRTAAFPFPASRPAHIFHLLSAPIQTSLGQEWVCSTLPVDWWGSGCHWTQCWRIMVLLI